MIASRFEKNRFLAAVRRSVVALFLVVSANAQVVISTSSTSTGVSNTDLLQTSLSSTTVNGTPAVFGGWSQVPDTLFNGGFGSGGTDSAQSYGLTGSGQSVTFNFDITASGGGGYKLTQINTYAGWDSGRDGQEYTVSYSVVSNPNTFIALYTITQFDPSPAGFSLVSASDSSGFLANHVASLKFTFTTFENSGTAYREIDVIGSAVPEPSTYAALAGLGALGFAVWNRRRRAGDV